MWHMIRTYIFIPIKLDIVIELSVSQLVLNCPSVSSRKILSGAYLLYYLRRESQNWYVDTYLGCGVSHTVYRDTMTLTSGLSS